MEKKSFLIGVLAGVVLSVIFCFIKEKVSSKDSINYYEQPVSYENEKRVTVKVFQVFKNSALALEDSYNNKTVLILGENFYTDQYVTINNPKIIGTYSYTTKNEMPLTVPIIDGKIEK